MYKGFIIAKVPGSVQKQNRILHAKALDLTPAYFVLHGAPGLQLQINF